MPCSEAEQASQPEELAPEQAGINAHERHSSEVSSKSLRVNLLGSWALRVMLLLLGGKQCIDGRCLAQPRVENR
jgi:hypothetical protein